MKITANKKIRLSRKEWENIGKKANWINIKKHAFNEMEDNAKKTYTIISDIREGNDPYFNMSAFHTSNLSDPLSMSELIKDIAQAHNLPEEEAASVVQSLSHGEDSTYDEFEETEEEFDEKIKNIFNKDDQQTDTGLPPPEKGWD